MGWLLSNEELDVFETDGVLGGSVPPLQYSPGWRSKKKATGMKLLIAIFLEVVTWAAVSKAWITLTRRGRTLTEG